MFCFCFKHSDSPTIIDDITIDNVEEMVPDVVVQRDDDLLHRCCTLLNKKLSALYHNETLQKEEQLDRLVGYYEFTNFYKLYQCNQVTALLIASLLKAHPFLCFRLPIKRWGYFFSLSNQRVINVTDPAIQRPVNEGRQR